MPPVRGGIFSIRSVCYAQFHRRSRRKPVCPIRRRCVVFVHVVSQPPGAAFFLRCAFPHRCAPSVVAAPVRQRGRSDAADRRHAVQRQCQAGDRTLQGIQPATTTRRFDDVLFLGRHAVGRFRPDRQVSDRCRHAFRQHRRSEGPRSRLLLSHARTDTGHYTVLATVSDSKANSRRRKNAL